jgi:hypothetical protein
MALIPEAINYTPLVTEWTTLTGSATVTTLLAAQGVPAYLSTLDAMTVTGSIPTLITATASQIFSCLVYSEVNALSAAQEARLWNLLHVSGALQGGSASTFIAPFFGSVAALMPNTITALTALSQAMPQPWWQANGYGSPTNINDLVAAGIITATLAHQAGLI